jgi:hypothetical protein
VLRIVWATFYREWIGKMSWFVVSFVSPPVYNYDRDPFVT